MNDPEQRAVSVFLEERHNLIALACSVVRNEAVAEELVQDSWLRWQQRLYPAQSARPILRRIVANLAKDWYRRSRSERIALEAHAATLDHALDSERVFVAREDLARVVRALRRLPERTRIAFQLHCIDELTFVEIGRRLGLSKSRVFELVEDALVHLTIALDG
ncbi:MAG: sigma-70 family RNA polymerase sigma factor [Pseudomonadota bacterium]